MGKNEFVNFCGTVKYSNPEELCDLTNLQD